MRGASRGAVLPPHSNIPGLSPPRSPSPPVQLPAIAEMRKSGLKKLLAVLTGVSLLGKLAYRCGRVGCKDPPPVCLYM